MPDHDPTSLVDPNPPFGAFAALTDMLTTLAAVPSSEVDAAVVNTLGKLCSMLGTERASIWQGSPEQPETLYVTHERALSEAPAASPKRSANELFPWMMKQLLADKTVFVPDVSAMPAEAAVDQRNLTFFRAQSSLVVPCAKPANGVRSVVTFSSLTYKRNWSEFTIAQCRLAAEVMISTLARKRADQAAEEDRARLRAVLDSAGSDLIWCVDAKHFHLETWNRAYADYLQRITGRVARFGDTPADRYQERREFFEPFRQIYERAVREGPFSTEFKFASTDHVLHLDVNPVLRDGTCVSIAVFARDLTKLVESQKMESLGRLAGGVAHDFNNLLQVICGVSELVIRDLGEQHKHTQALKEIARAGERAADLTSQLLAYARQEPREARVVDLVELVKETEKLLLRVMRADIELSFDLGDTPLPVLADKTQLHQVIVNLVVNARDATPASGQVKVRLSEVDIEPSPLPAFASLAPGRYVQLCVHDTGEGIAPEDLPHVFEPFFTTKARGKGTGLGLPTVLGIAKQSGGDVHIESRISEGTRVCVLLPKATMAKEDERPKIVEKRAGGGETVLIAEDHPQVRALLSHMLTASGYEVLLAADGVEALDVAEAHRDEIKVLITDIIMPRLSGYDLARAMRTSHPEIAILFTSGFSDVPVEKLEALANGPLLRKPYSQRALANAVRTALESVRRR